MPYHQTYLLLFLIFTCLYMLGCERDSAEKSLDTYHSRLANVLDVTPFQEPETDIIQLADIRELLLPVEDIRMGLLDAYELRKCGLFGLIAERNSVLGRVRDRTQQLRYELLFIGGLERCINSLSQDSELLPDLHKFHQLKHKQLPVYFWNMLTSGKEWRQQLRITSRPFALSNFPGSTENQEALHYLHAIHDAIQNDEIVPPKKVERLLFHQEQIHTYRYFGQLIYSITRTRDWLVISTQLLEENESKVICGKNRNQQKAEYLRNVFYRFFIAEIQPYLAELDSQYLQIQEPLKVILQPPHPVPKHFLAYYTHYVAGELHQSFRDATMEHVKYWQRTFKRCQMKIGV
ncbi:DUF3080 domain-containing protein [uncultured Photobacterium sp.]|uniref:DUF3080 domain-containing protein n=1 Tax=uncultured Photobacterium sp. TaxID=173973 RepID=UPI0026383395|nr:DUF3080 domain-containing protein [uncultured Photobacterium sp.]